MPPPRLTSPAARPAEPRLGAGEVGALLFAGIVGILVPGVGPLLLGNLEHAGRLSASEIGQAGTVELLAMGVSAGLSGLIVDLGRVRRWVVFAALAMGMLNALSLRVAGPLLVMVRGLSGVPSGTLIWLMTAMIVRAARPERWSAIYLTSQTLAQLLVVLLLNRWLIPRAGANGGFVVLAGLDLAAAAIGLFAPARFAPLPTAPGAAGSGVDARGMGALFVGFLFNAAILAVWIYLEPLARQAGQTAQSAGAVISISLAAQVAGGAAATVLGGRAGWRAILGGGIAAMLLLIASFAQLPRPTLFMAAAGGLGFLWMLVAPYLTPLVIAADPTRRSATFGSGAALLGCSAGPFVASFVVSEGDLRGAAQLGATTMLAALLALGGLLVVLQRGAAAR